MTSTESCDWIYTIRYHSLDAEMKRRFGEKVYRISLDAGMTCPNRDGTLGSRGCIFCSEGGSGDFAEDAELSIMDQIAHGKERIRKKVTKCRLFIAYFQAYTNTYAPVDRLRRIFTEAAEAEGVVALSIATRPDCLQEPVLNLLFELNQKIPVMVELGLQTMHEKTAVFIRRGYKNDCYEEAVENLKNRGIEVITHLILGLPGETKEQMFESIDYAVACGTDGLKLQLLHILKNTDLSDFIKTHDYKEMNMEEYANLIVDCLERIPPEVTIHRITGDGPKALLVAPRWSADKKRVRNTIAKMLRERDTWQGKMHVKEED